MDSENSDDGFARGKGEALEMGEDFDDSEEYDQQISDQEPPVPQKPSQTAPRGNPVQIKGEEIQNQPFDLAVSVNDSEEVDSDEEDDGMPIQQQPATQKQNAQT